ncbi:fasciclin domain-containing protein [Pontibacter rugosus]|uniref:Fasciclin domain-containing protein n=1 Tax=Pontibacter rugosus TaxID=1745966 RepID=A0ABW3SPP5_9BACT
MKRNSIIAYAFAVLMGFALTGCGTDESNSQNEMQAESTEPTAREEPDSRGTNPSMATAKNNEGTIATTNPNIGGYEMMPTQIITENITSSSELSTLASLIRKAGMVETLNATGPYTVFAPENGAFEGLPDGVVEDLSKNENNKRLTNLLNNHVVAGKLTEADLKDGASLKTVGGEQLKVTKKNGKLMINGAEVLEPDQLSQNGVIHVIGKVLVTKQ